jgi:molybdopterin/thiamine biosynthesis adenylyltransferase
VKEVQDGSLAAVAINSATLSRSEEDSLRNSYSGKKPSAKTVRAALQDKPMRRKVVTRADHQYLLQRTIGSSALDDVRLAIVGCGAVGSQIAVASAASGARSLVLIDGQSLVVENTYRHALGNSDVGIPKVIALQKHIGCRFPHTHVDATASRLESALDKQPDLLSNVDFMIVALGDETIERRLNQILGASTMRIHTWIEPSGLGGHCLLVPGNEHKGCYECMFAHDIDLGIGNMASLCARGQQFRRTIGGCAGTFTPFGYADTLEAAARTTRMLIDAVTGTSVQHKLVSWIGDEREYLHRGLLLSKRGEALCASRVEQRSDVYRRDCPVCSKW